ncbi:hypothetical protein FB45DRAFT_1092422 [Roridomyces roridus]|uniref:Methyltransferase n=1 Tax=Roridomyces roridus TaxID=1738132 RepID=A0AAD7FHQ3_9AGAR|nr:hypothetical protein FB45DRAFT_1092422 [Roridomyces roridus]
MAIPSIPSSTTAALNFFVAPQDGSPAFQNINASADGAAEKNFSFESIDVKIQNMRGNESAATLDTAGYQLFTQPAQHTAFANDAEIRKEYIPESAELIKKLTGASRVVVFDHTIRRRRPGEIDDSPDRRQPVPQTHVDQTAKSSLARLHMHLPPQEVPELLKQRFQIVNLWRPIDREPGETYAVRYNPNQKWTYFSGVTPDEMILIKCYDSTQDGSVALYTPHTAFSDPQTPKGAPFRESIELRTLVFYD